jgi:hypothetical protein
MCPQMLHQIISKLHMSRLVLNLKMYLKELLKLRTRSVLVVDG